MKEPVIIETYNEEWPALFDHLGTQIKTELKSSVIRVDHIGSTAVPSLAAKPILDIQISILDLNKIDFVRNRLEGIGFQYRQDNPDLTKRYFRETENNRRTHIHIREHGSWSEQFNLLFRDYLRKHENERDEYAKLKYDLAKKYRDQRAKYIEGKTKTIWNIMLKANKWSQEIGWKPSGPDF
ncbi:GrpB family protein [Cohnella sp.]|uniref:GrpB family protein n=1 Tax=Cohnella sp. TaxID=1883426 RepID=UPI003561EEE1